MLFFVEQLAPASEFLLIRLSADSVTEKMTETKTTNDELPTISEDPTDDVERTEKNDVNVDDQSSSQSSSLSSSSSIKEPELSYDHDEDGNFAPEAGKKTRHSSHLSWLRRFFIHAFLSKEYPLPKEIYNAAYISSILSVELDTRGRMASFHLSTQQNQLIDYLVKFYREEKNPVKEVVSGGIPIEMVQTGQFFSTLSLEPEKLIFKAMPEDIFEMLCDYPLVDGPAMESPPKKLARLTRKSV